MAAGEIAGKLCPVRVRVLALSGFPPCRGTYKGWTGAVLTTHRALGRRAVQRFQAAHKGRYNVLVPETKMTDYPEYLRTLLNTKVRSGRAWGIVGR